MNPQLASQRQLNEAGMEKRYSLVQLLRKPMRHGHWRAVAPAIGGHHGGHSLSPRATRRSVPKRPNATPPPLATLRMTAAESNARSVSLSQLELDDIRQAFELFDSEKKGAISVQELRSVLLQMDMGVNGAVDGVLESLQALPEGTLLSLDDFVELLTHRGGPHDDRDELRRIYDSFDTTDKGYIDLSDLRSVAATLGEALSEDELQEMITRASNTGDHKVTFDDFTAIMNKKLFS